ncbi:AAA domain-containing protein [Streptomyces sp. NBC_00690]|uniref:AAA domain-containing protein n=1 Tax=Streptomyces sp. NBC_00690 TaxID=2975808 RepID=UPI002E292D04|nr:AAA domain-containing protein [Streptomyces sp. NBC_00690]
MDVPLDDTPAEVVDSLFVGPKALYGPYEVVAGPETVLDKRLLRVTVQRPGDDSDTREVSLFLDVHSIAGELWEHEVRSLLRLQALGHPALPEIVDGSFDVAKHVAFTMTREEGTPLNMAWEDDFPQWAAEYRIPAFEQYSLLVDALSQLHGSRIMHRNLTLGAIRVRRDASDPARTTLALARFEMSALLGNLLRSMNGPDQAAKYRELVTTLYLTPPAGTERAQHLAYLAPETYPSLFDDDLAPRRDWHSTDVFGLGVFGWELFCGPLSIVLPGPYSAVANAEDSALPEALGVLHSAMRSHLNVSNSVPRALRMVLLDMLDPQPVGRTSSFAAARALEQNWDNICGVWEERKEEERAYLVAFMPEQSVDTLYRNRQWISHSPEEPAGRDELQAFLENELRQAELVWSQGGAEGFVPGKEIGLKEAEWVLIGEQAVWFCAFLYDETLTGRRRTEHRETLVIKYLLDRRFAQEILAARPRRRVGRLDLVSFRVGQDLSRKRAGRPSWETLTDSVRSGRVLQNPGDRELLRSLTFMLEYQRIAQRARQYPFLRTDDGTGGTQVLQYDAPRDRSFLHGSPLLTAYAADRGRRPLLGDFAKALLEENENGTVDLSVVSGEGTPYFGRDKITVRLEARLDDDSVRVTRPGGGSIPRSGWLRPAGDSGTAVQLGRQARGLESLRQKPGLMRALHRPASIDLGRGRWSEEDEEDEQLLGQAPRIIQDMLALHPFYALQGPPGSGKTTVAARALQRYLRNERGARVLVSAQSNFALDHLGMRLTKQLRKEIADDRILILRELPDSKGPEDLPKSLRPHTLEALTARLVKNIRQTAERLKRDSREAGEVFTSAEEALVDEWVRKAESNQLELSERIKAGASIVLATCSIAGTITDNVRDPSDVFDWVIIEEAAKAWPTEIIMPLVLGVRWTLIGDHRQLGPHRLSDVQNFLDTLEGNESEHIKRHFEAKDRYLEHLELFGSFFQDRPEPSAAKAKPPLDRLDMQFRMHGDIAEPVARTFYPRPPSGDTSGTDHTGLPVSFLQSAEGTRRAHRFREPKYLRGAPLVWLDTSTRTDCDDTPYWTNQGEIKLVEELVEKLVGSARNPDDTPLAVLTPYAGQLREMNKRGSLSGLVHTVHSFQGNEAERVVVSLVRSTVHGTSPRNNVGHVAQPELVNVLLSRSMDLLVVVGNLPHFERYGGKSWETVTAAFTYFGKIVDAATGEVR